MTRTPKYNRCDHCGRNAHKIATRRKGRPDVNGWCPSCWTSFVERTLTPPSNPNQAAYHAAQTAALADTIVIYDRRGARR